MAGGPQVGYATLPIIPSVSGMAKAIQAQLGTQLTAAGRQAGTKVGSGMLDSVRSSAAAAGRAVATSFTAATAATAGLAAAAVRTGTAYNQLEQSAGAAFSTLLGSRAEASDFMGEIREFAQSSPFPRQAFIDGAQQLVAFGAEAESVIPALDAIQDAVAASGGSAQQLSEVTFVLAQIQAAGKITATDLMQLGQRGIDAAGLIGSQMGKAGSQIRADITAGTLDAQDAIDALVAGMAERFGGAAEGLKETWVGSVDRIAGAWRDISSDLVEPFISKQGGGAAVEWANTLADTLRTLQAGPVADLADWLGRSAGSMTDLVTSAMELAATADFAGLVASARDMAPVLGAASGALAAIGSTHLPLIGSMLPSVNPVLAAVVGLVAASPEARSALADVAAEVAPLVAELVEGLQPSIENVAELLNGTLPTAIGVVGTGLEVVLGIAVALTPALETLTGILAEHEEIVLAVATAYVAWKAAAAGASAATAVAAGISKVTASAGKAATAVKGMGGSIHNAFMVKNFSGAQMAGGALAGIAIGATAATYALDKLHESGDRDASAWLEGLEPPDLSTLDGALDRVSEINARIQELKAEMDSGSTNRFDDEKLAAEINALTAAYDALQPSVLNTARGMGALRDETGLTVDQIEGLARSAGIDLTTAFNEAGEPSKALQTELDRVAEAAGTAKVDLQSIEMTPEQIAKLEADAEAVKEAMATVEAAFKQSFDVLSLTDDPIDPRQIEDAVRAVERAREQLADAEAAAAVTGQTAADQERNARALRDAEQSLADALQNVEDLRVADSPLDADKIREFYTTALADAERFNENIHRALQEGYDPGFVQRLLAAGPAEAGPILETLVASATGSFVEMVNSAEEQLSELSAFAVESARLTQQAINETGAKGQEMATLLETAIGISQAQMSSNAELSVQDLAELTGSTVGEVRRAMDLFGLEIQTMQEKVSALKAEVLGTFDGVVGWGQVFGGGDGALQGGRAGGGPVWPGTWLVGEEGPELLTLGGHGHVFDAAETSRMLAGDGSAAESPRPRPGGSVVVQTVDVDRAVDRLMWEAVF